jgi:hypothetical protein
MNIKDTQKQLNTEEKAAKEAKDKELFLNSMLKRMNQKKYT